MAKPSHDVRRAWTMTVLLMVAMALTFWDKAVLGLAAVPIMKELHLSNSMYGLASSSFYLLFTVAAILVGLLVDKVRSKWVFVALALLWAVAQGSLLATSTVTALFVSRIMIGAAEGPANPLTVHTVHSWFPVDKRSLPTSLTQIASGIGALTSAPILTWIITEFGWRWGFFTTAVLSALWALVYAVFGKDRPAEAPAPTPSVTEEGAKEPAGESVPYRHILLSRTFIGAVTMAFAASWSLAVVTSWLVPFFVNVAGFGSSAAGNMIIPPNVLGIVAILAIGAFAGRLMNRGIPDRVPLGIITGAVVAVGGAFAVLVPHLGTGTLLVCGVTLAAGLPLVAMTSAYNAVGRICPAGRRGAVLGTLNGLYSLGSIAGPYAMGLILDASADEASGYATGFTVTGLIVIAGGLCAAFLINPRRDRGRLAASPTTRTARAEQRGIAPRPLGQSGA
ncbi:MFS transporter [Streptomyces sp. NPDC002795]|uniref:MFS transporter n=1 Tax=Streptomyces sp. NPDC002795 TaxID=3364665 RepID=UPI003685DD60